VQLGDTGAFEGAAIDLGVQGVVAQVIERYNAPGGRDFHAPVAPETCEQCRGVVRHAGAGGR